MFRLTTSAAQLLPASAGPPAPGLRCRSEARTTTGQLLQLLSPLGLADEVDTARLLRAELPRPLGSELYEEPAFLKTTPPLRSVEDLLVALAELARADGHVLRREDDALPEGMIRGRRGGPAPRAPPEGRTPGGPAARAAYAEPAGGQLPEEDEDRAGVATDCSSSSTDQDSEQEPDEPEEQDDDDDDEYDEDGHGREQHQHEHDEEPDEDPSGTEPICSPIARM